jgi:2-succinyl-6-hydroxy-2,4-cyclohexadiene-1-carboxylate synthase
MSNYFHFKICGERQLPPILFLHGFLGDCEEFNQTIAHLSNQFCCVALDLPGHGKTIVTEEFPTAQSPPEVGDLGGCKAPATQHLYTIPQVASEIIQWLDRQNISRCAIVGYSMGGRLALYLTLKFPGRFSKVVLESASPGLKTEAERQARQAHDRAFADHIATDFDSFLTNWYQQPLFASLSQHPAFTALRERRSRQRPRELAKALWGMSTGNQPSLWHELPECQADLLLLVGADDRKFLSLNQAMAQVCPRAKLAVFPCGHVIHVECPDRFTATVRSFLLGAG